LLVYFISITVILIVWQLLPVANQFEHSVTGSLGEQKIELKDSSTYRFVFCVDEDSPAGFSIFGYNSRQLVFTDEKLILSYYLDPASDPVLTESYLFRNLVSGAVIYSKLADLDLKKDQMVLLQIQTEGLPDDLARYPRLATSSVDNSTNLLRENGELQEYGLYSGCTYVRPGHKNRIKPVIYFIAECILGLALLFVCRIRGTSDPDRENRRNLRFERLPAARMMVLLGAFIIGGAIFFNYVFAMIYGDNLAKRTFDLIHPKIAPLNEYSVEERKEICEELQEESDGYKLAPGEVLSQSFPCRKEMLSAIGVSLYPGSGTLSLRLFDEEDNLLAENTVDVSNLNKVRSFITSNEQPVTKKIAGLYYLIDLGRIITDSAGKVYRFELENTGSSKEASVLIDTLPLDSDEYTFTANNSEDSRIVSSAAVFSSHKNTPRAFLILAGFIMVTGVLYLIVINIGKVSPETAFLTGALVLGISVSVLIPPYSVPDEWAHIDTAYSISNTMLGINEIPAPGRILKRRCDINMDNKGTCDVTLERYDQVVKAFMIPRVSADEQELMADTAGDAVQNVTFLNYLPAAAGITVARLLGFNNTLMVLLARWLNLLAVSLLCFYGIRKIPFGKAAYAVIAMLPISLQQFASCSYDAVLIGVSYVFIGKCLALAYGKEDRDFPGYLTVLLSGAFVAANKGGVYIPVLGLILLLLVSIETAWVRKIGIILLHGLAFLMIGLVQFSFVFDKFLAAPQTAAASASASKYYTLPYVLSNLTKTIRIFQNTFFRNTDQYLYQALGGMLGRLNVTTSWVFAMCFFFLIILGAQKVFPDEGTLSVKRKWYIALLCACTYLLVLSAMLFSWTETDSKIINGVQGRYFLPVLGLFALLFRRRSALISKKTVQWIMNAAFCLDIIVLGYILLCVAA